MFDKKIFRLRHANEIELAEMLGTGIAICNELDFALSVGPGDGIVLADVDELAGVAHIRAIGIVKNAAEKGNSPSVQWKIAQKTLYPNPQGQRYWRQSKPFFEFANNVIERYGLRELFAGSFTSADGLKGLGDQRKAITSEPKPPGSITAKNASPRAGGYVYLFSSPHGYKIGKTRRMKDRSRIFSVKLPFDIELVHFAWFADYSKAELALHRRYARKRLSGEWFDLTPTEIDEIRKFTLP